VVSIIDSMLTARPAPQIQQMAARGVAICAALLGLTQVACTPALDWREVRAAGSGLVLLFPCKPASHERMVTLAGTNGPMALHACQADGLTWALAQINMGDSARVGAALSELRSTAQAKMGDPTLPWTALPAAVKATPHSQAFADAASRVHTRYLGLPDLGARRRFT
jgi:hypothetical protein